MDGLKEHLTLAVIACGLFALLLLSAHHMGAVSQKTADEKAIEGYKANVATCEGANQSNVDAIAKITVSLQTCEAGRLADKAADDLAIAQQKQAQSESDKQHQAALLKLNKLLQTPSCKQWATMPACTIDPPSKGAKK